MMWRFRLIVALVFITTVNFTADSQQLNTAPSDFMDKMFRKKTEEWREAYNSGDAKRLLSFYSEEAEYIAADIAELNVHGREKIISYLQGTMDQGGEMLSLQIISLDISGDLATVYSSFSMSRNGKTVTGRNVMALRKTGMKWQIYLHIVVEEHK